MGVQRKNKVFAYRVPIGDYNYLQCAVHLKNGDPNTYYFFKKRQKLLYQTILHENRHSVQLSTYVV